MNYRGIEDILNVMDIKRGYARAQLEIHTTNIKKKVGFFGPHERIIEVGDEHNMVLQ